MGKLKRLRSRFNTVAQAYHAARPDYPAALFDDLACLAELQPEACLLEVGCGTGKATLPLVERGYRVTCVELGANLAREARRNLHPHIVPIHIGPFESWEGPARAFDLVFAATAWHWIRRSLGYAKAHALLRPHGCLAFWSARHAFPAGYDSFFDEIRSVYDFIGAPWPGSWPPPKPADLGDDREEIEATGLFRVLGVRRYLWEVPYTAEQYIALLNTFSGHIEMDASRREYLFREVRARIARRSDPTIRRHWHATLQVARRVGS